MSQVHKKVQKNKKKQLNKKVIIGWSIGGLCLLSFIVWMSIGLIKENKAKQKENELVSDLQLVEDENFTNKDYITIKKDSVFYDGSVVNLTRDFAIGVPESAKVDKYQILYQDDNLEYTTFCISDYTSLKTDEETKDYIAQEVSSMDDVDSICFKHMAEAMYNKILSTMGALDSNGYSREFYMVNNVEYFTIKSIPLPNGQLLDVVFINDYPDMVAIAIMYKNTAQSLYEKENFIKTFVATKYLTFPQSYKTDIYLWRPAPDSIVITNGATDTDSTNETSDGAE